MTTRAPENDLTRFYALFPAPALARDLFNIIEGHRIDARLRRAYPGIRRDMDMIAGATLERRPEIGTLSDAQAIVESLLRHTLGGEADLSPLPPAVRGGADAARRLLDEAEAPEASVADARIYELIDDVLSARAPRQAAAESDAAEEGDTDGGAAESSPEAFQGGGVEDYDSLEMPPFITPVLEELMRRPDQAPPEARQAPEVPPPPGSEQREQAPEEAVEGQKTMQASQADAEGQHAPDEVAAQAESADSEQAPGPGTADARRDDAQGGSDSPDRQGLAALPVAEPQEEAEEDLGERVFHYDEWDHKIEDYRPAWCTLTEQRATRTVEAFVAATFHEFGGIVTQIRRNFQLMRPERLRKMRYQREGDDLDIDGLVEYVVDRRTRVTPTERVYIKRDKKDRDVTTAFLVDMSSSTDRKIDGRKRIIDIEKEALLLMCEALEAIRDEYAIYGFSGSGRDDCQFYVVKEIGERYDDRIKARIGGIYGRQKTRMGPAIRHTTRRLMGVDSNVKLMILLTDGKPYDSDTYQDNAYAQEDTKIALREARREKIHLFCVTVDREGADYLPHMYSDANFVIIDDVRTLPQKLPQLYRRLTT
jgi:nitric oxide reductase activation protein